MYLICVLIEGRGGAADRDTAVLLYHIISYIISCHILSYHIIYHIISYYIILYYIILYYIILYYKGVISLVTRIRNGQLTNIFFRFPESGKSFSVPHSVTTPTHLLFSGHCSHILRKLNGRGMNLFSHFRLVSRVGMRCVTPSVRPSVRCPSLPSAQGKPYSPAILLYHRTALKYLCLAH